MYNSNKLEPVELAVSFCESAATKALETDLKETGKNLLSLISTHLMRQYNAVTDTEPTLEDVDNSYFIEADIYAKIAERAGRTAEFKSLALGIANPAQMSKKTLAVLTQKAPNFAKLYA